MRGNGPDEEHIDPHGECAFEISKLRVALVDARDYFEHKDICAGRIADWKLGATCTCGGDIILATINAALSA